MKRRFVFVIAYGSGLTSFSREARTINGALKKANAYIKRNYTLSDRIISVIETDGHNNEKGE